MLDTAPCVWYSIGARGTSMSKSAYAMKREIAPKGGNFRGVCPVSSNLAVRNRAAEIFLWTGRYTCVYRLDWEGTGQKGFLRESEGSSKPVTFMPKA